MHFGLKYDIWWHSNDGTWSKFQARISDLQARLNISPCLQKWYRQFENTAQSKTTGTASWYLKCCHGQLGTGIPPGVSRQAQRVIHQLRLNRFSSRASYQALIGQIQSATQLPVHIVVVGTRRLNIYYCSAQNGQQNACVTSGDSIDITDVFQDCESLVEFLISSHLSPHIGGSLMGSS